MEIVSVRRNGLEKDPLLHSFALGQDAVHGQGGKHPVLNRILLQHLLIEDIVPESILLVTFDDDSEHVKDGISVPVECAAGDRDTFAQLGLQPLLIDFFKCEAAETVDGVNQPDILLE